MSITIDIDTGGTFTDGFVCGGYCVTAGWPFRTFGRVPAIVNSAESPARSGAELVELPAVRPGARDQELLDAAIRVFHAKGYAQASVQDLADELGILKGSVYHYIRSKEDLLFRLLSDVHEDVEAILADVAALEGAGPLERLHEYVRRHVVYTTANVEKITIYYREMRRLSDERRKAIYRRRKAQERFVAGLVREAQELGAASSDADAATLTRFLFGAFIWVYTWYRPGSSSRRDQEELGEACARFVLRGLAGGEAGELADVSSLKSKGR